MIHALPTRRHVLAAGAAIAGAVTATGTSGLLVPARAKSLAPTQTMRGGSNNYRPRSHSHLLVDRQGAAHV